MHCWVYVRCLQWRTITHFPLCKRSADLRVGHCSYISPLLLHPTFRSSEHWRMCFVVERRRRRRCANSQLTHWNIFCARRQLKAFSAIAKVRGKVCVQKSIKLRGWPKFFGVFGAGGGGAQLNIQRCVLRALIDGREIG